MINSRFVIIIEKKDKLFNKFLLVRKQSAGDSIIFKTENISEETNNGDISCKTVTNKLKEFNRNGRSNDDGWATKRTVQKLSSTDISTRRRQVNKNQDFLQNNNVVDKKGNFKNRTLQQELKLEIFCLILHLAV